MSFSCKEQQIVCALKFPLSCWLLIYINNESVNVWVGVSGDVDILASTIVAKNKTMKGTLFNNNKTNALKKRQQ